MTGITGFVQLVLVSTAQIAATLTPTQNRRVVRVITITGIDDHLRPEWLITITGMRSRPADPGIHGNVIHLTQQDTSNAGRRR